MVSKRSNEKQSKKRLVIIAIIIVIVLVLAGIVTVGLYYVNSSKNKETEGISALSAWAIGKPELEKLWGDNVGLEYVKTDKVNDNGTAEWWRFSCESTIDKNQVAYMFVYHDGRVKIQTDDIHDGDFMYFALCLKNWSIDSTYAYAKALKDPVVKAYLSRHITNNFHQISLGASLNETGEYDGCAWFFEWNTNRVWDRKSVGICIDGETGETLFSEEGG